ncbi:MAG: globin domain-containing protein [Bacteroidota bacterium]
MTQQDIQLVQDSMTYVLPQAQQTGERLYTHLFELAPEVKSLFATDIATQSRKLMSILVHITANLDQMDSLQAELADLAIKHNAYQVKASHYAILKTALMNALAESLEEKWTADLELAWGKAYDQIAETMIEVQEAAAQNE